MEVLRRHQVALFFVLAFGITWSTQLVAYREALRRDLPMTNEANLRHLLALARGELEPGFAPFLLLALLAAGPTVAGVVVTALVGGRAGLADLLARTTRVRVPAQWMALVLLLPLVHAAASLAVGYLLGGLRPIRWDPLVPLALAPLLLVFMLVFTALAEEVGWRGYALPALQRRHRPERASWILGVAWGLWHLPAVVVLPALRGDLPAALVVPSLLGLTLGVVGWTIVLTWIANSTGSVFWVVVLHGWSNVVQSYLVLSSSSATAQVAWGVLPWLLAVWVLRTHDAETLTRPRPSARAAVAG